MTNSRLTKAEEELMQLLWKQKEPCTVSQLIDQMTIHPKPPHSTISTIIRTLERKGHVSYKAYGRTHAYYPLLKKEDYTRFSIRKLVSQYFKGSPNELVSFLIEENDLTIKELSELIRKIDSENTDS